MEQSQIKAHFENIKDLAELKKIYRNLAKQLHPDLNPNLDGESFKYLQKIYNEILDNDLYFSSDSKIELEIEKVIRELLHYDEITIEKIHNWIWVSGFTKNIKEHLKSLNFHYASKKKMWYWHSGDYKRNPKPKPIEEIREKYGSTTFKQKEKEKITV